MAGERNDAAAIQSSALRHRANQERPSLYFERQLWRMGHAVVAGVDEVGRGAWAGPLVAAAVALPADGQERARLTRALKRGGLEVRDSKQLTPEQRVRIRDIVLDCGLSVAISEIDVAELDALGLAMANRRALGLAAQALRPSPTFVLVDAFRLGWLACAHEPIVRGDTYSMSIALASVIAKVHRDALMKRLDVESPGYGFGDHKGYGTAAHVAAIEALGITPHHRRSFAPIARWCARANEQA